MTGDQTQNKVQVPRALYTFSVVVFPIKPREQWDISTYLSSNVMMHGFHMSFKLDVEKKKKGIRENASMCVKLNLYILLLEEQCLSIIICLYWYRLIVWHKITLKA